MNILGLSFDYHDAAAALLVDGVTVAAAQEERISRVKHDAALPRLAAAACLKIAGISSGDVDAAVFYERPMVKFDRILSASLRDPLRGFGYARETLREWFIKGKFEVSRRIASALELPLDRVTTVDHHRSHAAAAFFGSDFERATVITIDGVGEYETITVSLGEGASLRKIHSISYPASLGLVYSAFTGFLGFEINEGEYKVMGMAGFGIPRRLDDVRRLMEFRDGRLRVDLSYFDFYMPEEQFFRPKFLELFGSPRVPEAAFHPPVRGAAVEVGSIEEESARHADLAASLQRATEEIILSLTRWAVARTGVSNVCLAGGVALNSLANGRIQRELGYDLFIQPAAGDAGGALGAAMLVHATRTGRRPEAPTTALLGRAFGDAEIDDALEAFQMTDVVRFDDEGELLRKTAELLAEGKVIGWFQGREEWGPRALGARSILADPTRSDMQRTINEKIKFREPFRPFAPAVLSEHADRYFELPATGGRLRPERFMLSVAPVRAEMRERLPAVTHVDGTARVQLVNREGGGRFRGLIEAFAARTGVPVLLNTSFNRRGEPIVGSPADAMRTFLWSGLDHLVIGNRVVSKDFNL